MKTVLVHVSSKEDYNFVKKLYEYFESKELSPVYICPNLIVFFYLKMKNENCFLAKQEAGDTQYSEEVFSFNVDSGVMDSLSAKRSVIGFDQLCSRLFSEFDVQMMVIPSGRMLSHKVMREYSLKYKIPSIYIGYGNFPGKTFLDCQGTDKASFLYGNVSCLSDYEVDVDRYHNWSKDYISQKMENHVVPQSRKFDFKFLIKRVLRTFVCNLENFLGVAHDIDYKFTMLSGKMRSINALYVKDVPEDDYVFFPMQLSNDAQVVLNYKGTIYDALSEAISIANAENLPLVVKTHPAEVDPNINLHLNELSEKGIIILSNSNTFKLINKSNYVITINSTVGMESRLLNKKVIFLGDSLFERIPDEYLGNYLMGYLFDLDYFNQDLLLRNDFNKLDRILGYANYD